ncbi:MAG: FadR/GntR family transcriptional regulator [Acidimicrobiales bacterium]
MATAQETEPSGTPRVSSSVVDHLRQMLSDGRLGPGDRLPAERDLAERLGVGRNSIREALRELEMLGLVEARRGAGTFVRQADLNTLMSAFRMVISLSEAAVEDVVEFRRAFEPEVAAMAARNADEAGIAELGQALRRFDTAVESPDGERPVAADVGFHEVLALCTGNPLVIAVQHALANLLSDLRTRLSDASYEPGNRAARGHQALFGAVVAGDPEAARDVMRQHLDEVESCLDRWRVLPGTDFEPRPGDEQEARR